jgi:MFS family permease
VGFFALFSSTMSKNPVLNPFASSLNAPEALLGFIAAASTIPGILVSLPAGSLSDILGRRKVLLVSGFVFASAPFLYLLVSSWWQLVLVRFYHGFATAMFGPVANAYVAGLYPSKKGERISLFSSATAVGRTLAPIVGGYILSVTAYDFHELYLAVGLVGVAAFLTMALLLKDGSETQNAGVKTLKGGARILQGWNIVAKNPEIVATSLVEASQYYAFGAVEFFLVGYLKEVALLDAFSIGIVSAIEVLMIPVSKPAMGVLSDRLGRRTLIIGGSIVGAIALTMFPLTTNFYLILLAAVVYGTGFSMVTSSTPALVSELTSKELMGTGLGFLSTIMDVGQTLGPIITGFILGAGMGYMGSFVGIAAVISIAALCFVAVRFVFKPRSP